MAKTIRVGAVSYLNAKPLYYHLVELAPEVKLVMDLPSRLADRLGRGELEVGLIPSVEYLKGVGAGYEVVPGLAIAARGAVWSVKLFSRVPIPRIRKLAMDEGSRTSQALVRVWLDARHGVRPGEIVGLPMGTPALEADADAVLVIGDRAMTVPEDGWEVVVDLGAAWAELTSLPFVFALWVVRRGLDLGDLPEKLELSKRSGLENAREIAREHGARLGLDEASCYDYLTNVLSYDLGTPEIQGLRRFAAMAANLGLAPEGADLVFHRRHDLAARR